MRAPLLLALALTALPASAGQDFAYVAEPAAAPDTVVVDVRPLAHCEVSSLAGARCLPAADLLGSQRQLPSWRDVLWLLGTVGLTGSETVLVAGQDARERDFVAGVLHLAGQRRVLVLTEPVARLLASGAAAGPGTARAFARGVVFEAPMRDSLVVLAGEVPAEQSSLLREEAADVAPPPTAGSPIAYGRDALESVAWFTRLRAAHGSDARVLAEGRAASPAQIEVQPRPAAALVLALGAATLAGALWLGLRRRPA